VPKSDVRFDTNIDAWEDWDYCLQLAERGLCGIRVAVPLLNYRIRSGGRREQLYSRMEELKVNIFNKWRKYMVGESTLMACGCSQQTYSNGGSSQYIEPQEGQVLMQYNGSGAKVTYRGHVTNTMYRFGSDEDHKTKYVHKEDVAFFNTLPEFKVVDEVALDQQLVAVGNPNNGRMAPSALVNA
jgi:hypothetical protein